MDAKDNIEFIKEELSNEEKFLEQFVKAEKFYKKYKKIILSSIILLIVAVFAYIGYDFKKEHDLKVSNEAYMKLLENPEDKESLKVLKEKNPTLYEVYQFRRALDSNNIEKLEEISSKDLPVISNIAKYHVAALKKDANLLYKYELDQKALLKDLAILDEAFLLYQKNDIKKAKERLNTIKKDSYVYPYAQFLLHYGLKAEK